MKMRPDQERVRNLLLDTVTLLCKNGLDYKREMKVQGLIGITIDDDDVFLVHFDELSELPGAEDTSSTTAEVSKKKKRSSDVIDLDLSGGPQAAKQQKLMDDGVMNNPMSKRLDLSSSLRQSHPDVKPKIKEEKLEDCVVLDDQFEDSKANIVGDFELENASNLNQMAALSGFPHGSSPAGAGGGGRGAPPGGPMSAQFFPGQPGAPVPPDMPAGWDPGFWLQQHPQLIRMPRSYRSRHSTDKQYVCTFPGCNRSFYEKFNLNRHIRINHNPEAGSGPPLVPLGASDPPICDERLVDCTGDGPDQNHAESALTASVLKSKVDMEELLARSEFGDGEQSDEVAHSAQKSSPNAMHQIIYP